MTQKIITIFGANGFIGSDIVRVLAAQGYTLRLPCKHPKKADMLKFNGQVGQIVPLTCDYSAQSIQNVVDGSYAVVNCTGILTETSTRGFLGTHCYLAEDIAKACKKFDVTSFVHISALGVDQSQSKYAKSKLAGEQAVLKAFPNATVLRPSIVFGPKDSFFNMFAEMAQILPALPLIGGGKTLFQPVYVGDVSDAVANAIQNKNTGVYELGGPDVLNFKALLEKMKSYTGQKVALIPIPFWIAKIQALFLQYFPGAPLTPDQVTSLKTHNIVSDDAMTLTDLGVRQTSMDTILPTYLGRFKK
jgi:NADH dehydrogenase